MEASGLRRRLWNFNEPPPEGSMMHTAHGVGTYDISVEHASLQRVPTDRGTRYSLHLNGQIDDRWAEAYRLERRESRTSSRFELDPKAAVVSFASDPGGAASADIIDALDLLDAMVERVNHRAAKVDH
jgi:hypothetical protein